LALRRLPSEGPAEADAAGDGGDEAKLALFQEIFDTR
jgi:hypothetical protein